MIMFCECLILILRAIILSLIEFEIKMIKGIQKRTKLKQMK